MVKINKNIGHIFREHNIIEYKSVDDYMHRGEGFQPLTDGIETPFEEAEEYRQEEMPFDL